MKSNLWMSVIACGVLFGVLGRGQDPTLTDFKSQERKPEEMRRVTVALSDLAMGSTFVGFTHTNSPPWPKGNCLTFTSKTNAQKGLPSGDWRLVNVHAENFHELTSRLHIERLELGLLADHRCLVIDPRVPSTWLLAGPCKSCCSLERRLSLRTQFSGCFRKDPLEEALTGATWVLVSRNDPDHLIERALPGDKICFVADELICSASSGELRGRRAWEFDGSSAPPLMSVYDIQSTNAYTGAALKVNRRKDKMILVPNGILKRVARSVGWEAYNAPAEAVYRIEERAGN